MKVIFVSFETLRKPRTADVFIEAWRQSLQAWQKEVVNHLRAEPTQSQSFQNKQLNSDMLIPCYRETPDIRQSQLLKRKSKLKPPSSTILLHRTYKFTSGTLSHRRPFTDRTSRSLCAFCVDVTSVFGDYDSDYTFSASCSCAESCKRKKSC